MFKGLEIEKHNNFEDISIFIILFLGFIRLVLD